MEQTALGLGSDVDAYRRVLGPLVTGSDELFPELLKPLSVPRASVWAYLLTWRRRLMPGTLPGKGLQEDEHSGCC